ncbi:MAG: hypothetical protein IIX93_08750 [Clostridia bacterium]|nr:hypothetical protein [Clostridia bacterium]
MEGATTAYTLYFWLFSLFLIRSITFRMKDLISAGQKRIILDGVYSWTEYKILKKEFPKNLTFVAIITEKGFLTSSCCPAFVRYIKTAFPQLKDLISHNPSPMTMLAAYIKETDPESKVVFIGPCTAKKGEAQLPEVKPYVDAVMTFEELQALFDSKDLDLSTLPLDYLDNASYFGRIFARSGGLSDAVVQALKEQGIDFTVKSAVCDGIEACKMALLKKSKNVLDANFIEGMACIGGCIGGAGCLTHGEKNKDGVDKYGREAMEKNITDAVSLLQ